MAVPAQASLSRAGGVAGNKGYEAAEARWAARDTALSPDERHAEFVRIFLPVFHFYDSEPVRQTVEDILARTIFSAEPFQQAERELYSYDIREQISEIRAPTLIVIGDHDPPDIREGAYIMRERIPSAQLFVAPACGHIPFVECPDLFPLPVDGGPDERWVLAVGYQYAGPAGGSGTGYFVGRFNTPNRLTDANGAGLTSLRGRALTPVDPMTDAVVRDLYSKILLVTIPLLTLGGLVLGYLILRFSILQIGSPGLEERTSGFGFSRLDGEELVEKFGSRPLPFYAYEFAGRSGYAIPIEVVNLLRERASNLAGMKVSDRPWSAVEPYLIDGLESSPGAQVSLEVIEPTKPAVIRGAEEAGGVGWMLWNPRNHYTVAALRPNPALAAK